MSCAEGQGMPSGGMHIIQSFIGCIATLINGSALDIYVAAAYRDLTGICNGKSWVKALRFSGCAVGTVEVLLVFRTEDIRGNRRVPGCCSSTSYGQALGGQLSPADSSFTNLNAQKARVTTT